MPARPTPKFNLRILILIFALLSAIATLANSFWVIYRVQKQALIDNALDVNRAYAARVAMSIEQNLSSNLDRLAYSAGIIAKKIGDRQLLNDEARRLLRQDASFNSVVVADSSGKVLETMPDSLDINGQPLRSEEPLQLRRPMVSAAFKSIAGNLVVFVSHPIWSEKGEYLGLVGGTIQLGQENALHALLGRNVRHDEAYIYVVDSKRRLLYHPVPDLVGQLVGDNKIVDAALHGESGAMQATNSQAIEMLAGYASVPSSQWGVVSQQPLEETLGSLSQLMLKVTLGIAPLGLLGFLLIWWGASRITRPLCQLADYTNHLDTVDCYGRISKVVAWYFESWQIRRALLISVGLLQEKIGRLNHEAQSDALTGLANRRAMEEALALWQKSGTSFSVISMDIDHFKRVNDTFGHGAGDETLRTLAVVMKQNSRSEDIPCRVGGEEFTLLLPNSSLEAAAEVAERLRASVEKTHIELVGHVTVSLGVSTWKEGGPTVSNVFAKADELLYQAKQAGRNCVMVEQNAPLRRDTEHEYQ